MAGFLSGESVHAGTSVGSSTDKQGEELGRWYMSRKEIEEYSPSRRDGIDLKKETYLRKSYCTFLQDLGMRLKVPQVTIATAIVFCHRFYIQQSHAKNDRRIIATVCMFLAGKVEETPRPLKDVILVSYEIIHKKDPGAAQRIKQKEVYEQQKELILLCERAVLTTLGFDLNVQHPYKPLVEAIKKFNVEKNNLAQVAWNFVNDGLRTSLCLQFKPHHIAAGAIFLAAKFLKVKLTSDGEKVWWQEFDVTPRQLEEVSNQMLELYEQNRVPPSQGSEVEGNAGGGARATAKSPANDEQASKQIPSRAAPLHSPEENHEVPPAGAENQSNDGSAEIGSVITDHKLDMEIRDTQHTQQLPQKDDLGEVTNRSDSETERIGAGNQNRLSGAKEAAEVERRNDSASHKSSCIIGRNLEHPEAPLGLSPKEAIKIDKDKVKAALEKRRKARGEIAMKKDVMDEDDLIERELEDGVELAAEDEKNKQERRQNWSEPENENHGADHGEIVDEKHMGMKEQSQTEMKAENAEEGEMIDDASFSSNNRKREALSSPDGQLEAKRRHYNEPAEEGNWKGRFAYAEKDSRSQKA
ncbi:cyclin-T1-3-like isoform X1 [Senna tora]|uniref:B-like cyclin n=1 Tax=Senna tora TaxID=362788 RepID=A0A835CKL4_9FABA|nr:cyclin-T1-3-like isoform X1 [Senna tora]